MQLGRFTGKFTTNLITQSIGNKLRLDIALFAEVDDGIQIRHSFCDDVLFNCFRDDFRFFGNEFGYRHNIIGIEVQESTPPVNIACLVLRVLRDVENKTGTVNLPLDET